MAYYQETKKIKANSKLLMKPIKKRDFMKYKVKVWLKLEQKLK